MDNLVATLGIDGLSKSQVSRMAVDLDTQATAFRTWPDDFLDPNSGWHEGTGPTIPLKPREQPF